MNYDKTLEYIHTFEKFGIKPGLERITALCRAFGNVQNSLKFIHVAGTNGKGSTSTMLSEIFMAAGYKTGLFISPYVTDFRERIQVNREMIPKQALCDITHELAEVVKEMPEPPTEFEFITAAALIYYEKSKCDVVVLETGLGGRLDSTNVIPPPLAAVITSISLDHTAILGDTIEKIAAEKCGIIKENTLTVCYPEQPSAAERVIEQHVKAMHGNLVVPDISLVHAQSESILGTRATVFGTEIEIPFTGRHMLMNAATAAMAAKAVSEDTRNDLSVTSDDISRGIAASRMPARMECLCRKPLILLDGGHNEGCAAALAAVIKKHLSGRKITAVCGMMRDKDYMSYLKLTAPLFERMITLTVNNPRTMTADELAAAARNYCHDCTAASSTAQALSLALNCTKDDDVILICGSFYLAGDIRAAVSEVIR